MREDVRQALAIDGSSAIEDRTIDIITTGAGDPASREGSRSSSTVWATTST
jgi:hypothetical protein